MAFRRHCAYVTSIIMNLIMWSALTAVADLESSRRSVTMSAHSSKKRAADFKLLEGAKTKWQAIGICRDGHLGSGKGS